jgi:hypothetical protein
MGKTFNHGGAEIRDKEIRDQEKTSVRNVASLVSDL